MKFLKSLHFKDILIAVFISLTAISWIVVINMFVQLKEKSDDRDYYYELVSVNAKEVRDSLGVNQSECKEIIFEGSTMDGCTKYYYYFLYYNGKKYTYIFDYEGQTLVEVSEVQLE